MAEAPATRVSIRIWKGLASNKGPLARQPGESSEQINCRSITEGILEPRHGFRPVDGFVPYGEISGVYDYRQTENSVQNLFVHSGSHLYLIQYPG